VEAICGDGKKEYPSPSTLTVKLKNMGLF